MAANTAQGSTKGLAGTAARLVLLSLGGALTAGFFWLWQQYGLDVVLAYAQGVAMRCF